ncbi:hypothetical protein B4096_1014 [Heyndrickxia coagulans]|nr:hypothetical protein B4096_1014 [Heyndrickxia coagulans]
MARPANHLFQKAGKWFPTFCIFGLVEQFWFTFGFCFFARFIKFGE